MQTFKIYVGTTPNDLKLVKYLRNNADVIKSMGVKLSITHLKKSNMSSELVKSLNRRGISRLPVMIADRKKIVGVTKITKLFKNNISNFRGDRGGGGGGGYGGEYGGYGGEYGTTAPKASPHSVEAYMASVLEAGEEDGLGEESDDMMRKYQNATTGRQPSEVSKPQRPANVDTFKGGRGTFDGEDFADSGMRGRSGNGGGGGGGKGGGSGGGKGGSGGSGGSNNTNDDYTNHGNYKGDYDSDDDNIASNDVMGSLARISTGSADDQMEAAYWANQNSSEGFDL